MAVAGVVGLTVLSTLTTLDRYAEQNYERLFQRAFVTFALARTINGVISAVQGTEVALAPAGVGVTLTPGEILDPVNDLIERFSWIMLGATVSLGVQQVLMDVGQWWAMKALVALVAVAWLWAVSWPVVGQRRKGPAHLRALVSRAFIVVLFLRFSVPLALIANEALYDVFLAPRYETSTRVVESAGADIEAAGGEATGAAGQGEGDAGNDGGEEEAGFLDTLQQAVEDTRRSLDLERRVTTIRDRAADLIEHVIQLSVVFVLQTGILPVAFLWLFAQVLKSLFRPLRRH
jgi:hypothetical protein